MTITYLARVLGEIHYRPGAWNGVRVGVFLREGQSETQIGEYERNYPSLFDTFHPFQANSRELALYSPHYTGTRLLELPSCRDIGGEEPSPDGFCPVDFYVPRYVDLEIRVDDGAPRRFRQQAAKVEDLKARTVEVKWPATTARPAYTELHHHAPVGPAQHHPFGFVAGCVWGDDNSWKVQYLDLSRAAEGILRRDDRFGYIELPDSFTLERAVDLSEYQLDPDEDYAHRIRITAVKQFDLRDGRAITR
ncbi:MAG TPA: hypothetical protein VKA54_15870 [Gemmatimonadaceae bacterium]|nr:hypothetical protein [Gemmatimonadaceae bacterium]